MIASITPDGYIIFDLDIQSPYEWITCLNSAFPSKQNKFYVGCYYSYEDCLWTRGLERAKI